MSVNYYKGNREQRIELFKKYYYWVLKTNDCDPAMFMMNYINKRMELNIEQRFWFAWLYGNTYNVATAWIIFNEFPDFENVDLQRLQEWNTTNYKRLRYQTDNKWQKGHLPAMFESYRANIYKRGTTQREYFNSLCTGDGVYNFYTMQGEIVKNWYKFGRYLSWFYLQTLRETCDLDLQPQDLLLKDDSSKSHRNGLIYALSAEAVLEEDSEIKPGSKDFLEYLDLEADTILAELRGAHKDVEFEYFTMETALCSFKKFFRDKRGRYFGYYLDRQAEDIKQCEADGWVGIDWELMWDARKECIIDTLLGNKVVNERMGELIRTGTMKYIDWYE